MKEQTKFSLLIAALLAVLMISTRAEHLTLGLPDASWAVFILGGLYLKDKWAFLGFALLAWIIDLWVFRHDLGSAACLSPGYSALIITWMVLWFNGRLLSGLLDKKAYILSALSVIGSVFIAFVISNLGYYAFSEYSQSLTLLEYAQKVSVYLPRYILTTFAYVVLLVVSQEQLSRIFQQEPKVAN